MYSSLGSGRNNQTVLKVLVLLSFLLLILLCYQHHNNQKTQLQLQKDVALGKQRAKQVEYELDSIQKGLQMDLNKERTEHRKTKTELAEARNSMEAVAASQKLKEQTLEEYYGKLQECQKQNVELEKVCDAEMDKVNVQLNDCLGKKMALERDENDRAIQQSKNSNEVNQLRTYLQQLQSQIQEKDTELERYKSYIQNMQQQQQGMNNLGQQAQQHQMGQNNMGGGGNADLGGAQPQQHPSEVEANNVQNQPQFGTRGGQNNLAQNDVIRLPESESEQKPNVAAPHDDADTGNHAVMNANNISGNEGAPINWRSQSDIKEEVPEHNLAGPEAPDGLVEESKENNVNFTTTTTTGPALQGAAPMHAAGGQLKPPSGAEVGKNLAEVDVVAGDGKGALLPPMGDSERQALEERIEKAREEEESNAEEVKREPNDEEESIGEGDENLENEDTDSGDANYQESERGDLNDESVDGPNSMDSEREQDQIERELSGDDSKNPSDDSEGEDETNGSEDSGNKDESLNDYRDGKEGGDDSRSQNVKQSDGENDAPANNNKMHDFNDGSELKENLPDFEQN